MTRLLAVLLFAGAALAQAQTPSRGCQPCAPGPFDSVEIAGSAIVRFTQGAAEQVSIEGDEEAQKAVELEVRDGVLMIRPNGGWKFWKEQRARLDITARDLKRVTISGAADFTAPLPVKSRSLDVTISGAGLARFDRLQAEALRFKVSGAGDGQLAGRVDELQIMVSGRGEVRGENLLSRRAKVAVSGTGEVRVWATQWLGVDVSGVGTVDYWGTPQVERHSSGVAKINERGAKAAPP